MTKPNFTNDWIKWRLPPTKDGFKKDLKTYLEKIGKIAPICDSYWPILCHALYYLYALHSLCTVWYTLYVQQYRSRFSSCSLAFHILYISFNASQCCISLHTSHHMHLILCISFYAFLFPCFILFISFYLFHSIKHI